LERPELMDKMVKAYKLQETLKKERQQVKLHEEEYKNLMETIVASKVQRLGKYEVSEVIGQKKRLVRLYLFTTTTGRTLARTIEVNAIAASSRPTNLNLMAIEESHLQVFLKQHT